MIVDRKAVMDYTLTLIDSKYNHILEFGVADGPSLRTIRSKTNESFKVFGFDTFTGLPEDWINTCHKVGAFSTGGVIPNIENVTFFKGLFKDTLPDYLKSPSNIALLHVDCDLYESTVQVLEALNPFIVEGSIILFDEWIYWSGKEFFGDCEQKAFFEWANKYNRKYELLDFKKIMGIDENIPIEQQIVKILA